ncbi:ABC transporter ATP-binding protein [uncultured Desulfobacter sp.]|uniref:ABC transporter ATP-binding protein n=1 Tax=uncultured Desulfobacter sp. TaxID=240139 RepID=UPI002AAAEDB8|nr:ABC transporter ATP-binding protein [uncultured Desulfobacter sp.]
MGIPIQISHVSKIYKLYDDPSGRLKEAVFRGKKRHREFPALKDISFSVGKGETIGVIGRNGSGKSTLLQIIASIVTPTSGRIDINGRISALLELGSGFDPEFTGRENVYLNGSILGLSQKEIEDRFDQIERFADIGRFMDQPVKNYSSGMYVRLAFAVAVNVNPDILLVDEALAVGDVYFQHRCMTKIREFQKQGKTIFFVTHDTGAIIKLCTKAMLLERGEMVLFGKPDDVVQEYYRILWNGEDTGGLVGPEDKEFQKPENATPPEQGNVLEIKDLEEFEKIARWDKRFGNDKARITGFLLTDNKGRRQDTFKAGMEIHLSIEITANADIEMPLAGFIIKDLLGNELIKTNSDTSGTVLKPCQKGDILQISFIFLIPMLRTGSYSVSAGFGQGTLENHVAYDWLDNFTVFSLDSPEHSYGMLDIPVRTMVNTIKGNF